MATTVYNPLTPKIIDKTMLPGDLGHVKNGPEKNPGQAPTSTKNNISGQTQTRQNFNNRETFGGNYTKENGPDVVIDVKEAQADDGEDKPSLGNTIFTFVNKNRTTILIIIFAVLIAVFVLYLFYFRKESAPPEDERVLPHNIPPGATPQQINQMRQLRAQQLMGQNIRQVNPHVGPESTKKPAIKTTMKPQTPATPTHEQIVKGARTEDIQNLLEQMKAVNFEDSGKSEKEQEENNEQEEHEDHDEHEDQEGHEQNIESMMHEETNNNEDEAQKSSNLAADEGGPVFTSVDKMQCMAVIKKNGKPCPKKALNGSKYCLMHKNFA